MVDERIDWRTVDVVQQHMRMAQDYVVNATRAHFTGILDLGLSPRLYSQMESPLEAIFQCWWYVACQLNQFISERIMLDYQQEVEVKGQRYRIDFVLKPEDEYAIELQRYGIKWPLVAVEVDGHTFHEKTKEQVALRNKRDRDLQSAGWKVFHYSWAEVTSNPAGCVGEVFSYGRDLWRDTSQEIWRQQNPIDATSAATLPEDGQ